MNAKIIVLFLVLIGLKTQAQSLFTIQVGGAYSIATTRQSGWKEWATSFNTYYGTADGALLAFDNVLQNPAVQIGGAYYSGFHSGLWLNVDYGFTKSHQERLYTYYNADKAQFQLNYNDQRLRFDIGKHYYRKLVIAYSSELLLRNAVLKSSTIYPNGTVSYGAENHLHGIYQSHFSALNVGVTAGYRYHFVKLYGTFTLPLIRPSNATGLADTDLPAATTRLFPKNFAQWLAPSLPGNENYYLPLSDLSGMHLSLQLSIELQSLIRFLRHQDQLPIQTKATP